MKVDLRYGPLFRPIRKIAKYILSYLYYVVILLNKMPKVKSIDETIDELLEGDKSICRFGDGEFLYMLDKFDMPYQRFDNNLFFRLTEILKSNHPNILIGIPHGYNKIANMTFSLRSYWRSQIAWIYPRLKPFLQLEKQYYNSSFTRFYMDFLNKEKAVTYINKIKKLWYEKNILIIEGNESRLGVGNDLFAEAKSVQRILGPRHNAFDNYDIILEAAKKFEKDTLILLALGSTATVLAYDLTVYGFRALDIGNVDIEYEWFLIKATKKVAVPGKYTSEASGGRDVKDCNDKKYLNEIFLNLSNINDK
jgi:glycosyltransferase family protein